MPVVRTEDLKAAVYCLQQENLILSPLVLVVLQRAIDNSMYGIYMQDVVSTTTSGTGGSGSSSDNGKYIMHIYCIYMYSIV